MVKLFPNPPKAIYFEKRGAGVILRCQIRVNSLVAIVFGDNDGIGTSFLKGDLESHAVAYVESLGYVQAVDWQLPPPTA
jgi:hypothetical protein